MLSQRDFSPFIEALLEWFYDALPPYSKQITPSRRAVYPLDAMEDDFLTVLRFQFAWDHTSRQMLDPDTKVLLQFVMTKLASLPSDVREECIAHLENDEQLKSRFRLIGSYWPGTMDYEADVIAYQMCCLLFQRFYNSYRRESQYERNPHALDRYMQVLLSGLTTSSITTHSVSATLLTQFCLFYMRWYFFLALAEDAFEGIITNLDARQVVSYIFRNNGDQFRELAEGDPIFQHELVDQPWTLLYLLNSWRSNSIDVTGHRDYGDLEENVQSCLVPLHDNSCCRRSDVMHHAAACNVLTMISHLLHAPEGNRMELLRHQPGFDSLFNDGDSPFVGWLDHTKARGDARLKAPSNEFLTTLRDARLDKWLEPGNDLSSSPSLGTSEGRFLHCKVSHGEYNLDNAVFPPSPMSSIVDVLRALARRVDFGALPIDEPPEPAPDPDLSAGAAEASVSGSHDVSTSESSSNPEPTSVPFVVSSEEHPPVSSHAPAVSITQAPVVGRAKRALTKEDLQAMLEWEYSHGDAWKNMGMTERWTPFAEKVNPGVQA
ncbi:hypothetical protein PENSPDRAFT_697932 [Peniophora sp. CONT]|nr:hypothetical protein PENSPDRAFT_697932 [Peniophora sp. CONT]